MTPLELLEHELKDIKTKIAVIEQRNILYPFPPNIEAGNRQINDLKDMRDEYNLAIAKFKE